MNKLFYWNIIKKRKEKNMDEAIIEINYTGKPTFTLVRNNQSSSGSFRYPVSENNIWSTFPIEDKKSLIAGEIMLHRCQDLLKMNMEELKQEYLKNIKEVERILARQYGKGI